MDKFDKYYSHLLIWDNDSLEIVGSYRIGFGKAILEEHGINGFYSSTLFNFSDDFIQNVLPYSIELGRSFVRQKYWNSNALDYLWQGIGAIIANAPELKYLFGPVSISEKFTDEAISLIISYTNKWYRSQNETAEAKNAFLINDDILNDFKLVFTSDVRRTDYNTLTLKLNELNFKYPILFKHYAEIAEDDGVNFLAFNIDRDFSNCVDGLLKIEVEKIKERKKERYIYPHKNKELV